MIAPVTPGAAKATSTPPGGPTLGKQEFLKLLITQLRNQDPMNPLDQNQFLSQTAQFTSLENLQNIVAELAEMKALTQHQSVAQGAALLGRTATASARQVAVGPGGAELPVTVTATGGVRVDVVDAAGTVVRSLLTESLTPGTHAVAWDGLDVTGVPVAPGSYHYRVTSQGGAAVAAQGTLTAMTPTSGGIVYHLGDARVRAGDLITVG
ncbi:MAG: flagellar hook assembly protein FlgD [Candidatus Rokubacteria bacterium]|nr:flagellar hook assembly protein FlgD [Candidatus Rokubacteria bacterium]